MTDNLFWHPSTVSEEQRRRLLGQRGCVLWFTGLSGSGKSTVARALETELIRRGHLAFVLDGDNVRHGLNAGLGFSEEDRDENLRRVAEVARLFADCGVLCITAFISPLRRARERAGAVAGTDRFLEVHLAASLAVCEERDTKGLYRKARAGSLPDFTGVSAPFEAPEHPDLTLDTGAAGLEACVGELIGLLDRRGFLSASA